jgi:hypothetical protein
MSKRAHTLYVVNTIRRVFGLNINQISEITGVCINALNAYNSTVDITTTGVYKLYTRALMVDRIIKTDIRNALKSVVVNNKTLLTHLKDLDIDIYFLIWICKQLELHVLRVGLTTPIAPARQREVIHTNTFGSLK